jgi:hypothetical protein
MAGDNVLFRALQASLSELPGSDFERAGHLFNLAVMILANPSLAVGLTTQASQRGSVCAAFGES